MTTVEQFAFDLPPELIARYPAPQRTASRLLRVDCIAETFSDALFTDLSELLEPGTLLVFNNTRVVPARFYGEIVDKSRAVECLFLRYLDSDLIEVMARPMKHLHPGTVLRLAQNFSACVEERGDRRCHLRLDVSGERPDSMRAAFEHWLNENGEIPLPPYLGRPAEAIDADRYQTVYAQAAGAVAAPTAGLHFDQVYLDKLAGQGVEIAFLNLLVGAGTFEPVRSADIESHQMHEEEFFLNDDLIDKLHLARREGRRVVAVGTTVVRALESAALNEAWHSGRQSTELMIRPGFSRRVVDALLTNFHLPRSSLMVLVCALGGTPFVQRCYAHAIAQQYRFYSYGDAMYFSFAPAGKTVGHTP